MTELLLEGRLVMGHPMNFTQDKQDNGMPKMQKDGVTPSVSSFIALAIPKAGEQHWNQTAWGAQIWQEIVAAWPNGEYQNPSFSFKIEDGDSQIPNKKGKKNADKTGHPGHWIVKMSTMIPYGCFHAGKYLPTDAIQVANEIKTGDYARVNAQIKSNQSTQTAGMYINPNLFELSRAGELIVGEGGADAATVFGGAAYTPPAAPAVAPAADFLNPPGAPAAPAAPVAEKSYNIGGVVYTETALRASGWTDVQLAQQTPVA